MHLVLLALGVAVALLGLVLVVLALPVDTVTLGNTLLLAGTVAIVGSLILMSIASAIRQLRRIAQALEARPAPRAIAGEEEAAPRLHGPVLTPRSEPRVALSPEPPPPIIPEPGLAPVSEPAEPAQAEAAPEFVAERLSAVEVVSEPPPATEPPEAAEPPPLPEPHPVPASPPEPAPPPPPRRLFDAVWSGETQVRERDVAAATVLAERPPPPALAADPEVRIFKSGVIDGMAYTLYTDGSIEAQLADGTVVTFASIDELRAYLAARE
jgi:hypothetical protein